MPRGRETAEERRRRLIAVAREVIAAEGVAACTFRRLAAAAGTSTRPFTHAFGTRDELLRAVALSTWEGSPIDVAAAIGPVERPSDWDCLAELLPIGEALLPLDAASSLAERVYIEIILHALTRPDLHRELLGFSAAANAHLEALVVEGQRRGQVTEAQPAAELAMAYWGLHEGLAITSLYEPRALPPAMVRRLWREGVRRLLAP